MAITRIGGKRKANRVDAHVGRRLRLQRLVMRVSLKQLAEAGGVSFHQVQKYEGGIDRVPVSCLYRLAEFLRVPVSYFFAGLPAGAGGAILPEAEDGSAETQIGDLLARRETAGLIQAYYRIKSCAIRSAVRAVMRGMANSAEHLQSSSRGGARSVDDR
jgi:transcriptional regulator with XRE-family HTH domain